jgi:ferredoxin
MLTRTTKSLIFLSLLLTFAVAQNEEAAIPTANSQLAAFIQSNADEIKAQPDIDVDYCLQQFTSTTFESQYGAVMGQIIEAGCMQGLQLCDINDLYGVLNQLQQNGFDGATLKQIHILIGSMIGSMAGEEVCDGVSACEWLGGKIGAALTCLSVTKEVFQAMETAVSSLKDAAMQTGQIGQDAVNAITDAANSVQNGVQDAIDQINTGNENDAISALKGATDDVGQAFTDLGNDIANGLNAAGGAIADAGQQAVGAVEGVGQQAVDGAEGVGNDIKNGICGIFGC